MSFVSDPVTICLFFLHMRERDFGVSKTMRRIETWWLESTHYPPLMPVSVWCFGWSNSSSSIAAFFLNIPPFATICHRRHHFNWIVSGRAKKIHLDVWGVVNTRGPLLDPAFAQRNDVHRPRKTRDLPRPCISPGRAWQFETWTRVFCPPPQMYGLKDQGENVSS